MTWELEPLPISDGFKTMMWLLDWRNMWSNIGFHAAVDLILRKAMSNQSMSAYGYRYIDPGIKGI